MDFKYLKDIPHFETTADKFLPALAFEFSNLCSQTDFDRGPSSTKIDALKNLLYEGESSYVPSLKKAVSQFTDNFSTAYSKGKHLLFKSSSVINIPKSPKLPNMRQT
jgi:hypothetical protein